MKSESFDWSFKDIYRSSRDALILGKVALARLITAPLERIDTKHASALGDEKSGK